MSQFNIKDIIIYSLSLSLSFVTGILARERVNKQIKSKVCRPIIVRARWYAAET